MSVFQLSDWFCGIRDQLVLPEKVILSNYLFKHRVLFQVRTHGIKTSWSDQSDVIVPGTLYDIVQIVKPEVWVHRFKSLFKEKNQYLEYV